MDKKTLNQIVAEKPFHDYAAWWPMGQTFVSFMSEAILSQWSELHENDGDLGDVRAYVAIYLKTVFGRETRPALVEDFVKQSFSRPIQSGEFDALSYAFYRAAFELIERHLDVYDHPLYGNPLAEERRSFTKRVGKIFFRQVHDYLPLALPNGLHDEESFARLKECIQAVGAFLRAEGYLRDHFAFSFTLDVEHAGRRIGQREAEFLANLNQQGMAYALYEMGYPVILPSAVYLYHTLGEAQHHSSRTIEELFAWVGYEARETDDFDPTGYPADKVVELWEIRKLVP